MTEYTSNAPLPTLATGVGELLAAIGEAPSIIDIPLDEARAAYSDAGRARTPSAQALACDVTESVVPETGCVVAVFVPRHLICATPVLFLHGGGFIVGDVGSHGWVARETAAALGAVVVLPEYRLAPEHPYPAPLDDCVAAARWVAETWSEDGATIAVAGDSAGGNLAAAMTLRLRDSAGPVSINAQLLAYPMLDATTSSPSMDLFATGSGLDAVEVRYFWDAYLADSRLSAYSSPSGAESLGGLPPAVVVTAELDVLRDEAEAFARRLGDDGVDVTSRRFDGLPHGFFDYAAMPELPAARSALHETLGDFRRTLLAAERRSSSA